MQVQKPKQGYKIVKTNFRKYLEIPSDWNVDKVKKHVEILVGYSFPSSEYSDNPDDIKLVRGDNVTEGRIRWEDKTRFWKNSSGLEKYLLYENDFVISMDGSKVGKNYAYITRNDVPSLLLQRVARLRTKETLTQQYLGYIFGSPDFIDYVNSVKTNAAIPHISQKQIENFEFILLPKHEQQKIASILSNIDYLIQQTQKEIEQTQRLKKGLMQKLLTKGIGHTTFKKTKLGEIPEEWKIVLLENCIHPNNPITYGIVQAGPHIENGIPYIRTGDMKNDRLSKIGMLCTSKEIVSKYKRSEVKTGELVFAIRATVGKVLEVPLELDGANLTQGTARISPNAEFNNRYLLNVLRSVYVQKQIREVIKGTTFAEITLHNLRKIKILKPSLTEQKKIAGIFNNVDLILEKLIKKKSEFEILKKGLMQKLLTGQIRVKI